MVSSPSNVEKYQKNHRKQQFVSLLQVLPEGLLRRLTINQLQHTGTGGGNAKKIK